MRPRKIITVSIRKEVVVCVAEFRKRTLVSVAFEYPESKADLVELFKRHRYAKVVVVRKQSWPPSYWRNFIANGARWLGNVEGLAAHWRIPLVEVNVATVRNIENELLQEMCSQGGATAYPGMVESAQMAVWGKMQLGNRNNLSTKSD